MILKNNPIELKVLERKIISWGDSVITYHSRHRINEGLRSENLGDNV